MATLELQDLHLHGRCFTWSNERENPTLVRLDRVLVSLDWENMFPNAHLRGLGSDASDHCALLLQTNLGQMSKARFHFELFWPNFDDYSDTISQAWSRPVVPLDPLARFDFMLRNLVRQLKSWSAARIGEIRAQLLMARELVLRLDTAQERRQLTEAENALRKRLKMRCLGLSSLIRTMARQRSRVRQLSDGDANTAYFHLIARGRKRRNYIPALAVNGHLITDHSDMELALHSHFAGVFGTVPRGACSLSFDAIGFPAAQPRGPERSLHRR